MAIEFTNRGTINRQLNSLEALVKRNVINAVEKGCILVEGDAVEEVSVDIGDLRSSIGYDVNTLADEVEGIIFASAEQAPHIEFGTEPHFPPVEPLEEWARRHGLDGLGFVIAQKISREGTSAKPFMQPALDKNRRRITRLITNAIRGSVE